MEDPERPIQRPKDQEAQQAHYSGKKKQHTVKNNLMINGDSKVVLLTRCYEGRIHDNGIADMTIYFLPRLGICIKIQVFKVFQFRVSR